MQALYLHSSILEALKDQEAPGQPGAGPWPAATWNKVLDISVLTQNGLRMVEACKARICPDCENQAQRRITCGSCSNGRIIEDKVVHVHLELGHNTMFIIMTTVCVAFVGSPPAGHSSRPQLKATAEGHSWRLGGYRGVW